MKTKKQILAQIQEIKEALNGYCTAMFDDTKSEASKQIYLQAYNRLNAELAGLEWVLSI